MRTNGEEEVDERAVFLVGRGGGDGEREDSVAKLRRFPLGTAMTARDTGRRRCAEGPAKA